MRQRLRGLGVEEAMRRCYRSFGKRGFYSFSQIFDKNEGADAPQLLYCTIPPSVCGI
jgi:hypothetical protein